MVVIFLQRCAQRGSCVENDLGVYIYASTINAWLFFSNLIKILCGYAKLQIMIGVVDLLLIYCYEAFLSLIVKYRSLEQPSCVDSCMTNRFRQNHADLKIPHIKEATKRYEAKRRTTCS